MTVDHFADPETFRDYFKSRYGLTIATYQNIADDPDRVAALNRDLAELAQRHDRSTETTDMGWEYSCSRQALAPTNSCHCRVPTRAHLGTEGHIRLFLASVQGNVRIPPCRFNL